ncbi:3-keto-disaccharide hydrolase [Fimbriiglobus ruber]|uniref:High-affnity carbon uptake protein Hat/HatR n=1 Tax=Fimbriiglobus ruber TaxID=1908690 RepID=A0A225DRT2_9BACT|nr:DUF1080 domain-containing protein [Fimbriiglobus ruber]OWK42304.1 High-affnity carbon uptake protein Hat/HatR [Fimbriiglobus ruber]
MNRAFAVALMVGCAVVATAADDNSDPIRKKLDAAKAKFEEGKKAARAKAKEYFDQQEAKARDKGDKKRVDQIKDERRAFDENMVFTGNVPVSLKTAVEAPQKALEAAFATAVKEYTRTKKDDLATAVEQEWKEWKEVKDKEAVQVKDKEAVQVDQDKNPFTPLFNGKDLTGWGVSWGGENGTWKVVEGAIQGEGKNANWCHLAAGEARFADFHLKMEVFRNPSCEAGVLIRNEGTNQYSISLRDGTVARLNGNTDKKVQSPANEWYIFDIIARGNKITTYINARKCANAVDDGNAFLSGRMALRVTGEGSVVRIRKIEIMNLGPATPPAKK